jgi:hypothetical protein
VKTAVAPLAHEVQPAAQGEVVAELAEIYIEKGTPAFMRTVLALFCGGFATFALLYCVQPMMPLLSHEYSINAAQSSLIMPVATDRIRLLCAAVVPRIFHQRGAEQPDPVGGHGHACHRPADHRPDLRPHRA